MKSKVEPAKSLSVLVNEPEIGVVKDKDGEEYEYYDPNCACNMLVPLYGGLSWQVPIENELRDVLADQKDFAAHLVY